MKIHNLLEIMPRTAFVHIEDNNNEVLFRGMSINALKQRIDNREIFTLFSMCDYTYGCVLYISLEEDSND